MTDAEMLALATQFTLISHDDQRPAGELRELIVELHGPGHWVIIGDGQSLNAENDWESLLDSTASWPTAQEAVAFAQRHLRFHPTGYKIDEDDPTIEKRLE